MHNIIFPKFPYQLWTDTEHTYAQLEDGVFLSVHVTYTKYIFVFDVFIYLFICQYVITLSYRPTKCTASEL